MFAYPRSRNALSVRPQTHVAMARMKVAVPMMAWTGTSFALNLAVALSQANNAKKLNIPTTSCNMTLIIGLPQMINK